MRQQLTNCDKRLLAYLSVAGRLTISSRHLAETLTMSRRTIQASLERLNDLGHLRTVCGSCRATSLHEVLSVPVPYSAASDTLGTTPGAMLLEPVENPGAIPGAAPPPLAQNCTIPAQPPGAVLCKSPPVLHSASTIRARVTDTSLTPKKVSESTARDRAVRNTRGEAAYVAAQCFGVEQLDWQLAARFDELAQEHRLPTSFVAYFIADKFGEKFRARYRIQSPGALYQFVASDLVPFARTDKGRKLLHASRDFLRPDDAPAMPPQYEYEYASHAAYAASQGGGPR